MNRPPPGPPLMKHRQPAGLPRDTASDADTHRSARPAVRQTGLHAQLQPTVLVLAVKTHHSLGWVGKARCRAVWEAILRLTT